MKPKSTVKLYVRPEAHRAAKVAAAQAGVTLTEWASDALLEKAERVRQEAMGAISHQ